MSKEPNPNHQLEEVIKDSNLPELGADYAEIVLDGIMDDGVLKDLPLVGSVVGLVKFGSSLNKHFTAKKLYKFLFELKSIPQEQRTKKIEEINSSKEYQSTVGEMIFELLEKLESDGKPEILGKLFKAVLEEKISYKSYLRLAHIIKKCFYYDLLALSENSDGINVYDTISDEILTSDLIDLILDEHYDNAKNNNEKKIPQGKLTSLGKILVNIGMK